MIKSMNTSGLFSLTTTSLVASIALFASLSALAAEDKQSSKSDPKDTGSGTLYFINGDRLSGSLDSISDDGARFHWKIAYADDVVEIDRNKIAAIDFNSNIPSADSTTNAVVNLTNGDEIFARLSRLLDSQLELSTTFADELSLNRQMVGNIEIMNEGVQILANIESLDDWENAPSLWTTRNGSIIAPSSGQIACDIGDAERLKISFDLTTSASTYSIAVHAFVDNPKSPDSGTSYNIRIGNRWLQASKTQIVEKKGMFRDDGRDTIVLGKETETPEMRSLVGTRFDFYFDRVGGKIAVYMNDSPIGTWNDPGEFINPGSFISLTASSRERVLFDDFSVHRWNGILPIDAENIMPKKENAKGTTVSLANGDALTGTINTIYDDTLLLDTSDFGELRIATSRIRQLDLSTSKLWNQARRLPMDVLATFRDGSKITFALTDFSNGIATLYSENFGTIHTNLENLDSLRLLHLTESSIAPMSQTEFRFLTPQEALGDQW